MKTRQIVFTMTLLNWVCSMFFTGCGDTHELTVKNLAGVSVTMTIDGNTGVIPPGETVIFEVEGMTHTWSTESSRFKESGTVEIDGSAELQISSSGKVTVIEK
ncbi:hypothetical protein HYR99_34925 [Candidatus Poribacteria bacterium]|nr:hypothetical protein [Candidatus Poribacteria bacterium]